MNATIIGVMGPGDGATDQDVESARELGRLIAQQGWILLTGGRRSGVMHAASEGAKSAEGLTIGILPSEDGRGRSEFIDIPIVTGMGSARNNINVLSSHLLIACGNGLGTTSEIALGLKASKHVILLNAPTAWVNHFRALDQSGRLHEAGSPSEAIRLAASLLKE